VPFVGGRILSRFIEKLTKDDKLPLLNTLAVKVAYGVAKEHGINLNHGFDLELAAAEWKNWYASACRPTLRSRDPCRNRSACSLHTPVARLLSGSYPTRRARRARSSTLSRRTSPT
jgi:hypothetical protein